MTSIVISIIIYFVSVYNQSIKLIKQALILLIKLAPLNNTAICLILQFDGLNNYYS